MSEEGTDDDFVQELVCAFMEECQEGVTECQRAHKEEDKEAIRTAAHGLKGSAAIFGAEELSETAKKLEFAIKVKTIASFLCVIFQFFTYVIFNVARSFSIYPFE